MLPKPPWLIKHMKAKQALPDQITILSKPQYTGAGADGMVQPWMPVPKQLHEGEGVVPNAIMQKIGGNQGLSDAIMQRLKAKGINKMPEPSKESIAKANAITPYAENLIEGTVSDRAIRSGGKKINPEPTFSQSVTSPMPAMIEPTLTQHDTNNNSLAQMPIPNLSTAPQPAQTTTQPAIMPLPNLSTAPQPAQTTTQPAIMPSIANAPTLLTPQTLTVAPQPVQTTQVQNATIPTINTPVMPEITAPVMQQPPQVLQSTQSAPASFSVNTTPPTQAEIDQSVKDQGFKSAEDQIAAAQMQLSPQEYYAEMAARQPSTAPAGAPGMAPVSQTGMDTYRKFYDYAAQQADARSAVGDQALAMRMAQNPNLTEGAKNTMLQEAMMTRGSQQSRLAGDAAQQAISYQTAQADKAMNAMLQAGDVDGYAKAFRDNYGVNINAEAMRSDVNRKAFNSGMADLTSYVATFGENTNVNAPEVQSILKGMWAASGTGGEMPQDWATTTVENIKMAGNPIYQAQQAIPEQYARDLLGSAIFGDEANGIPAYVDPVTKKTGYAGFQASLTRDIMTGFVKIDKATGNITINDDSVLFKLGDPDGAGSKITLTTTDANGTTVAKTAKASDLTVGQQFDHEGSKWTVTGSTTDGKKIIFDGTTWANVSADGTVNKYTGENDTGIQAVGDDTYFNGKKLTVDVGGTPTAIKKVGDKYTTTIDGQEVEVSVSATGVPTIEGSYFTKGKYYVGNKEVKSPNNETLTFTDSAKADLAAGKVVLAKAGNVTYRVSPDGDLPEKLTVDNVLSDIGSMDTATLTSTIAALKANKESPDKLWTAYSEVQGENVDPAILNALITAGSAKAKEAVTSFVKNNTNTNIYDYPEILKVIKDTASTAVPGGTFKDGFWTKTATNVNEQKNLPVVGGIVKIGDKYYYVKSAGSRFDAGGKYWNYPRTLVSLDGNESEMTVNYLST